MTNNWTPSPATAPAETPSPELVFDNVATQTDRELAKLKEELDIHWATPDARHKEIEKVEAFFREKKDTITKITREEINNIKTAIHDENQEIEGQLQLTESGSIELNNSSDIPPETPPTSTPEPVEKTAPEVFLTEPAIPEDLIPPNRDYVSKTQPNWFANIILQFFGDTPWVKRWVLGFKNDNEMQYTETAMKNIIAVKWSPANSLINFNDLSIRDFRDILGQFGMLDFWVQENVEAAFLGRHADNPKYLKYHRIYNSIEDLAKKIKANWDAYDPTLRMTTLLQNSLDSKFDPQYTIPEDTAVPAILPTPEAAPTLTEEEALKSAQELDEAQNQAQKELDQAEAIPDNPEAINIATEKLKTAKEAVAESIDGSKKALEEHLVEEDANLKKITEIDIPMAQRSLTEAESALAWDPENTDLKTKKETLEKNLKTLKEKAESLKGALKKIREEIIVKFDWTPGITTALSATNLLAEAGSIIDIANGAIEVAETRTENQTAEEKEKGEKEKEEMKKWNELYQEIRKSELGYKEDKGRIYVIYDGNLFRFKYTGSWFNRSLNWITDLISDEDLPRDLFASDSIEMLKWDNSWENTQEKTLWFKGVSWWSYKNNRTTNNADAPENLKYYKQ